MRLAQTGASATSAVADRARTSKRRAFIYATPFAMTAVNYTDRVNPSVAGGTISHEFGLSPADLGWLLSAHLRPCIICLAPAGVLVNWAGYQVAGWLAVGFWSLCTIATGFVKNPNWVLRNAHRLGWGRGSRLPDRQASGPSLGAAI